MFNICRYGTVPDTIDSRVTGSILIRPCEVINYKGTSHDHTTCDVVCFWLAHSGSEPFISFFKSRRNTTFRLKVGEWE